MRNSYMTGGALNNRDLMAQTLMDTPKDKPEVLDQKKLVKPNSYQRQIGEALMAEGSSTAPVQSWGEGIARALQGVAGGYFTGKGKQEEADYEAQRNKYMIEALTGEKPIETLQSAGLSNEASNLAMQDYGRRQESAAAVAADQRKLQNKLAFEQMNLPNEIAKRQAGAARNINNIDVKAVESIAKQVGPLVQSAYDSGQSALNTITTANRIKQALESDAVIVGAGANQRLPIAQLANTLGLTGKDENETLQNTRTVVQGLAELTLQARGLLQGQGQITEKEQALVERARGGELNFTKDELFTLMDLADRGARAEYQTYQQKFNALGSDPNTAGLQAYFQLPAPVAAYQPASRQPLRQSPPPMQTDPTEIDSLINLYNPQ